MMHWAIDTQIEQFSFSEALAQVSQQRREHVLRFRHEHDRRLSLAAYLLLQRMLSEHYDVSEPPLFDFLSNGKPVLRNHSDIFFSLSHCHEAVACAVGAVPVGIDVESLSNYDEGLLAPTMNAYEQQLILRSPNPPQTFLRLWTMKEGLLKMTGEGIVNDMRSVLQPLHTQLQESQLQNSSLFTLHSSLKEDSSLFTFTSSVYPDFVCTVCTANPAQASISGSPG